MHLSDYQTSSKLAYLAGCYEDQRLQSAPSSFKAHVGRFVCGDKVLVVKSYDHAHPLLRATVCRILLSREIKALERLQGVPGVPEFYGRHGRYGLAMAVINGRHPDRRDPGGWAGIDSQLARSVSLLHQRGVTHNDLRLRNIIIDTRGKLYLIDYASAHFRPKGRGPLSLLGKFLFSKLVLTDRAKVLRLRMQFAVAQDPPSAEELQLLLRANRLRVCTRLWKRYVAPLLSNKFNRV